MDRLWDNWTLGRVLHDVWMGSRTKHPTENLRVQTLPLKMSWWLLLCHIFKVNAEAFPLVFLKGIFYFFLMESLNCPTGNWTYFFASKVHHGWQCSRTTNNAWSCRSRYFISKPNPNQLVEKKTQSLVKPGISGSASSCEYLKCYGQIRFALKRVSSLCPFTFENWYISNNVM